MKHSISHLDKERIESLGDENQDWFKKSKRLSAFNTIWQHLITIFTKQPELQVRQRYDHFGNTWWEAYDPVTGCSASFDSEVNMLAWIEKRYYR